MDNKIIFYNGRFIKNKTFYQFLKDRGFNFGESVYEVIKYQNGILICFDDHIERMERGLREIGMKNPLRRNEWKKICLEVAKKTGNDELSIYIQVTGGATEREHFVERRPEPNYFVFAQKICKRPDKLKIILHPEIRWKRVDIKTTNLLPNVLAKFYAKKKNYDEAIFFEKEGAVKEGTSTNVFYEKDGIFFTPELNGILPGVTRKRLIEFLRNRGIRVIETKIFVWDLFNADSVYLTGTTTEFKPVCSINGVKIKINKNYKTVEKEFLNYLLKISK